MLSAVTGAALTETGVTQLGFLISIGLVMVLYPALRIFVLRESQVSAPLDGRDTLVEA